MAIPFVGREGELRTLRAHFDDACAQVPGTHGGPKFVLLAAESGVGKSRLVQQLYHQLTTDPRWDPPEVDYWPDAFGGVGDEVRVNPEMQGHRRHGPARFFWLGVSWTEPGDRKAPSDRALTALKHVLDLHVGVRERDRFSMAPLRSLATEVATEVAESVIPGLGVGKRALGAAGELWRNFHHRDRTIAEEAQSQALSVTDDLLGSFRSVLEGKHSIPIVLWLDDAHWIDDESVHFIRRLWTSARDRRWPLLIVATHWEREWREQVHAMNAGDDSKKKLATCMGPRFEPWELHGVEDAILRQIAASALPGLSVANLDLLVEKACSNCLMMVENIGELRQIPANFANRNLSGDLSDAGRSKIQNWKKDRSQRAKQRFGTIGENLQDLLGWSSRLGQRFLSGVVTDFAARERKLQDAEDLLEHCVDPFAILARPSKLTRQFRDKAFYHVARSHFDEYNRAEERALTKILRQHLVAWINNSFAADGEIESTEVGADSQSAAALLAQGQREELRDLLDMARAELPLCKSGTHLHTESLAGLRCRALALINDASEDLFLRAQELAKELEHVDWAILPAEALGIDLRSQLTEACGSLAKHDLAVRIQRSVVLALDDSPSTEIDPSATSPNWTPGQIHQAHRIIYALNTLTRNLIEIGNDFHEATEVSHRTLNLARRLQKESGTDRSRDAVARSITLAGKIHSELQDYKSARRHLEEALAIRGDLAADTEDPKRRRDHAMSMLEVCDVWSRGGEQFGGSAQGDPSVDPREMVKKALGIMRDLVSRSPTPTNLIDLARALESDGRAHQSLRFHVEALVRYDEANSIRRQLFEDVAAPRHGRALAKSLVQIGEALLDQAREIRGIQTQEPVRELCLAQERDGATYTDPALAALLDIWRAIPDLPGDSESSRQKGRVQELLGVAYHRRGHLEVAKNHYRSALNTFESIHAWHDSQDISADVERLRDILRQIQYQFSSSIRDDDNRATNDAELQKLLRQLLAARSATCLEEALELWQDMSAFLEDSESLRQKARIQELLGVAHHERGHTEEAETNFRSALGAFETLHASAESRETRSDVERLRGLVGLFEPVDVQHDDSSEAKAIELRELQQQLSATRAAVYDFDGLAVLLTPQFGFSDQGPPQTRAHDSEDCPEYGSDEQAMLHSSLAPGCDAGGSLSHAKILEQEGSHKYASGNLASALDLLIQACALRESLLQDAASSDRKEALLNCLYGIGKLSQELGVLAFAIEAFTSALKLSKDLLRESGSGACLRTVAVLLGRLGDAELANGSHHAALKHYRKSLKMLDALLHGLGTSESRREVAFMLAQIGRIQMEYGDLDGALESFREATSEAVNTVHTP